MLDGDSRLLPLLTASSAGQAVVLWSDSDVEFLRGPTDLVAELDDGSCLLTPHRYNRAYPIFLSAPGWELTELYGRFDGGSIAFRRRRARARRRAALARALARLVL